MPGRTQSAGPYELRLPIFLQPLGGALKNRSAAPASPPCFRRRRRSAPLLFESTRAFVSFTRQQNKKLQRNQYARAFLVGAGGFEPPKLKSSRFTVCPHWPLGNTPRSILSRKPTACIFYHHVCILSTAFSLIFAVLIQASTEKPPLGFLPRAVCVELVTGVEPATH